MSIGSLPYSSGRASKCRTCFSCREPGYCQNECSLLAIARVQEEGKKLSVSSLDLCDVEPMSQNFEFSKSLNPIDTCILTTLAEGRFFWSRKELEL